MLWKILLLVLVGVVAFGGKRRLLGVVQSARAFPGSFREGKAKAEDPVPFAREVEGSVRDKRA